MFILAASAYTETPGGGHTGYKEEVLYNKGGEAVARAPQRGGGAPSLRTAKVRPDGAVSTDGAVGVPVRCRGLEGMAVRGPFQLQPYSDQRSARRSAAVAAMPAEGAPQRAGAERGWAAGGQETKRSHPQRNRHPPRPYALRRFKINLQDNIHEEIIKERKRQDTDAVPARPPGPAEPPQRSRRSPAPTPLCGATVPGGPPPGQPASPARRPLTSRSRPAASATGGSSPRPAGLGHGEEPRR